MLRQMGEVSGVVGVTCPWQAMRDPFVIAVVETHRALQKEIRLAELYPLGVPYALMQGLQEYEAALDRVTVHDMRERMKERERERGMRFERGALPRRGARGRG